MACKIATVAPGSLADRLGIRSGDTLDEIAGEPIIDQIDYQALTSRGLFELTFTNAEGTRQTVTVRKSEEEPLGISLDQAIVARPRECHNHCVFCFIDQMPPNMRDTLYVKDDDWRLSLMMGNFVTLTNVNDTEFDRILRRHVSPLYISVHCTDPEMRVKLMKNPRATRIMERLQALKAHGIRFHCQVVLCPGWNDGDILRKTLADLSSLRPNALSVALVPVGLTKYREGLAQVEPYNRETARQLVEAVLPLQQKFLQELGTRFVFPSDEFYCLSGVKLPEDEEYEGYPQIENGVGMLRLFETDLRYAIEDYPCTVPFKGKRVIGCGTSVAPFMRDMVARYAPAGADIEVHPVLNHFFGTSVTVTGLLTGQDLIAQLKDIPADEYCICRNTLRNEGDLFLDGTSVEELRAALPAPVRFVENTGLGFWRALCGVDPAPNVPD